MHMTVSTICSSQLSVTIKNNLNNYEGNIIDEHLPSEPMFEAKDKLKKLLISEPYLTTLLI